MIRYIGIAAHSLSLVLLLTNCELTPKRRAQYEAASEEFRRNVEQVDFKGGMSHDQVGTRGTVEARFRLRDPGPRVKPSPSPSPKP